MQTINITKLPSDIQDKIPVSIRIAKSEWKISELPDEVQYLVYKYIETIPPQVSYPDDVYDSTPNLTAYNDIQQLDLKQTILEYLQNILSIPVGSYPFDVTFGSKLKEYLHTKDTHLRQTMLDNEIQKICNVITNDFNIPVTVKSIIKNPDYEYIKDAYVKSGYSYTVIVDINGKTANLSI